MSLHPHLHLLIPSSSSNINLEARIYLPSRLHVQNAEQRALPLVTSIQSTPVELSEAVKSTLRDVGITMLVTAAHPWQKLGGNMLDPVLCKSLTRAVYDPSRPSSDSTALVTFNVRGVGCSGGSIGLLGLSTTTNERDFSAVEDFAISLFRPQIIKRVGYSWGSVAAVNASPKPAVKSILLVSPPSTLFSLTTLLSSRTFNNALKSSSSKITVIHGTRDQFTSVTSFQALAKYPQVELLEVEGADHFYRDRQSARMLESSITEWLYDRSNA